jgi:Protein of unknown function (DUF3318)
LAKEKYVNSYANDNLEILEIQRLMTLLPEEMRSQVTLLTVSEIEPDLVATQRVNPQNYLIQIDFNRWKSLNTNQRNLLFWYEVACIQGQGIRKSSREAVVMGIGGIALLAELLGQNLLGVVTTLVVTGLAGYQLYQQHYGERSLRAASAADRDAIQLAMHFGYSFPEAYDSLCSALQALIRWKSQKSYKKRYQVRLRVLEILSAKEVTISSPAIEIAATKTKPGWCAG